MGEKTAGTGHFQIPTAPAALTAVAQSASANTLGSAVSFGNSPSAMYITGVYIGVATTQVPTYVEIQILVAAAIVASVLVPYGVSSAAASSVLTGYRAIYPPIPVANAAAITVKSASSVASAVAWGVSLECIAQANVVDDGVNQSANVIQWNSTNVSAPATAGVPDVNVKNINNVAAATPGAAGGALISGSNAGTTTLGALTVTGATTLTGNVALADGMTIAAPSTGNRAGLDIAGNGTGAAMKLTGGATGQGALIAGGATSGDGVKVTTTSGHGINLAPVGASMHGLLATGGNSGTSDGIKAAAGTGGVDLRANQTGNLVGTVSTLTTYTGNTPQTGDAFARLGAPAGASVSADVAAIQAKTTNLPAAPASTTNITAAAGCSLAASQHVIVDSGTVTTVTNQLTAAQIATGVWQDTTAGDFTAANSVGKSVMNGVALGTGLTINAYTGNTAQTGDSFARLGAPAGASHSADVAAVKVDTAAVKIQTDKMVFTVAGYLDVNAYKWLGGTIPAVNVTGVPLVDMKYVLGTISPATAGSVRADAVTGNVGGNVVGSVASVVARVTANTDQLAGQTVTAAAGVTFPTSVASPTNITAGTITTTTNLTNAPTAGDLTATMKASVTTAATAATPTAAAVTAGVTVTTNNDKTGYALSGAGVQAVWDALTSALTTVGSIGKKLADWTIGTAQTGDSFARLGAPAGASVSADIAAAKVDTAAIKLKTDNLPASPAAVGSAMTLTSGERTSIANEVEAQIIDDTDSEKVLTAITDKIASVNPSLGALTLAAIGSQVRTELSTELGRIDVAVSTRLPTSSYAAPPSAAANASAVRTELTTELGRVDVATSTRLATAGYTAPDNAGTAAIKVKTDNLPAAPASTGDVQAVGTAVAALSIPTAAQNAAQFLSTAVDGAVTLAESVRLMNSALGGKASGLNSSTPVFRDLADTKDRLTATVDTSGNRTAVARDLA